MKKFLYLALIIMPFALASCSNDDDSENNGTNGNVTPPKTATIIGTWTWHDDMHPFTISFKESTYVFETIGFKDSGSYTYQDSLISCNFIKRWNCGVNNVQGIRSNDGVWEEEQLEPEYKGRSFKVKYLSTGACIGDMKDDFYGGEAVEMMLISKDLQLTLQPSDLEGEWVYKEGQIVYARMLVANDSYTIWEREVYSQQPASLKQVGKWTYANGFLNLTPSHEYYSSEHNNATGGYTYSEINPETLEAATWYEAQYTLDPVKRAAYLANGIFYIQIAEEELLLKFKKK